MVAPTNFNLQNYRGRTFQGFVQFQIPDGSTWYRMKERQNFSFNLNFNKASHYSDDGQLALDPAGISHSFNLTIKLTSDMFDGTTFGASSDKKTLSYWIYKNQINEPIEVIFVASFQTIDSPDNKDYVNLKFRLHPNSFSSGLGANGGSPELTISGNILEITNAIREIDAEQ
jgi:hypothetical protein